MSFDLMRRSIDVSSSVFFAEKEALYVWNGLPSGILNGCRMMTHFLKIIDSKATVEPGVMTLSLSFMSE